MIMRPFGLALVALGLIGAAPAAAEIGAMDPVPSATLLFPYFEAETGGSSGVDTLLTIENSANDAQLAHLIVWTDRGVPVLEFDLYITGHGAVRIPMRALISGTRPTSAAGAGESGCGFPLGNLDADTVTNLRAALTGKHMPRVSDANLGCPGVNHDDTIARGYVTVDTVTSCNTNEVATGTYWSTKLSMDNTLLGTFAITQGQDKPAYAEQAVHIEADDSDSRIDESGEGTFYAFYVSGGAQDHRERLPTLWNTQVLANRSDIIVWRETKRAIADPGTIGCGTSAQAALDLTSTHIASVNEAEWITEHGVQDSGMAPYFQRSTGRYPVGGTGGFPFPYRSGAILTNLNYKHANDPGSTSGLGQSVVLSARSSDAIGTPKHGTLALGTPLDDGFMTLAINAAPAMVEIGPDYEIHPKAMLDPRAAATLVLPYFEVSLNDPNAAQTTFSIVSEGASARLVKVTLFTDRGVPTIAFNVYLTGFDIATIDLRVLFTGGHHARTGSAGQDPNRDISPQGPFSQDINFASCNGTIPYAALSDAKLALLREAHTGKPVSDWNGQCGGRVLNDNVARGYIVIDDFNACSGDPLRAADFGSIYGQRDGLGGTFEVRNRTDGFSYGGPLVAVHGVSPALDPGDLTFYGWLNAWAYAPQELVREPLPDVWRVPFLNDSAVGSTELIVFRPVHRNAEPYACDSAPGVFSGGVASLVAYDGGDNSMTITGFQPGFVAGRVPIGQGGIQPPYGQGALEIDLKFEETENAPTDNTAHMGFIGAVHRLAGNSDPVYSQGFPLHLAGEP